MRAAFHRFGERKGLRALSPLVCKFYDDALATSSKKTYKTGTNHFKKFLAAYPKVATVDLHTPPPSQQILTLCFFAVALFVKKAIKSASTIRSYVRHVKNQWIRRGCDPKTLKSNVLDRVLKGLKRWLPPKRDARPAFLLPHYKLPTRFCHPTSGRQCTSIAAVIFGLFGLARFHVLEKMSIDSLTLVDKGGHEYKIRRFSPANRKKVLFSKKIIGFYFEISDKFHPVARVYLPKLSDTLPKWRHICPLRALRLLWAHNLLNSAPFSKKRLAGKDLVGVLKIIDGNNNRDFKTQSLRIGAQTFFVTYGLPEAFVEFLARRKSPRVAQIYYRASARLTLHKLRNFALTFNEY